MWRYGFTLWFAVTALLGPGVCYRALAGSVARAATVAPAKPDDVPNAPTSAEPDNANTGGNEPVKCPPGQGKKAQALPPTASPDAAAELRLPAGFVTALLSPVLPAFTTGHQAGSDSAHLSAPLAGRDLLAAYCLLRC